MSKEKKKHRQFRSLDEMMERFGTGVKAGPSPIRSSKSNGTISPTIMESSSDSTEKLDPMKMEQKSPNDVPSMPDQKEKPESMTAVKKRVEGIVKKHLATLPPEGQGISTRDVKRWILEHPSLNINGPEFLSWARNPSGSGPSPYVLHFGSLLNELGIEHHCDVDVRGYVYDFHIVPMNLYVDIDPVSMDTDDPKAKLSITVNKNKVDVMAIWRGINESRPARCKPYRFMAIKERLYAQGVKEFMVEYLDFYYQKMINREVK